MCKKVQFCFRANKSVLVRLLVNLAKLSSEPVRNRIHAVQPAAL